MSTPIINYKGAMPRSGSRSLPPRMRGGNRPFAERFRSLKLPPQKPKSVISDRWFPRRT